MLVEAQLLHEKSVSQFPLLFHNVDTLRHSEFMLHMCKVCGECTRAHFYSTHAD